MVKHDHGDVVPVVEIGEARVCGMRERGTRHEASCLDLGLREPGGRSRCQRESTRRLVGNHRGESDKSFADSALSTVRRGHDYGRRHQ